MIRWLSVEQAARRLSFSRGYVRVLIREGAIPAVKAGPAPNSPFRVTEQAVDEYLKRRTAEAAR